MLKAYHIEGVIEAGCDEAGRGPLAGSVFAAAVVWDNALLQQEEHQDWKAGALKYCLLKCFLRNREKELPKWQFRKPRAPQYYQAQLLAKGC